jgi:SAM-dependent methyltransferase
MSAPAHRSDRPPSVTKRAVMRALRQVVPNSTAGLQWRRQGEHITFEFGGFVAAPDIPMLFARHHYETALITELLSPRKFSRSLEFGCGFGRLSPTFAGLSQDHVAVDINSEALAAARDAYPELTFQLINGDHLPFPDGSFDLVVTWTVLQHVPPAKIAAAITEIKRVLAPGGVALLCEETRKAGESSKHCWHRAPDFYEQALDPLRLAHSSYIEEIDRLPGMDSPGRVMLFVPED